MSQIISAGRWRGLKTTSLGSHVFTILAFDQRGAYQKLLPEGASYETAVQIKREVVVSLSTQVSAVLLDATYGLLPALEMSGSCGLLMALEKSGYSGDATYRHVEFDPAWTVAHIKQMGASAVKLLVYYHPYSGALAEEIEGVVGKVAEDCHHYDLPLFVEPIAYALDVNQPKEDFAHSKPEVVAETARRLSRLKADVLKMEFPVDATFESDQKVWQRACEAISTASDVPWVLLSAGVPFATFVEQVRVACLAGASGFLAGRAIWKEAVAMTQEERAQFLATTARDRLAQLSDISTKHARPWTDFYDLPPAGEAWYTAYQTP